MSRPQWAVKCVEGEHKGKWASYRYHPEVWRLVRACYTKAYARGVARAMKRDFPGTWIAVPVPEPEVK